MKTVTSELAQAALGSVQETVAARTSHSEAPPATDTAPAAPSLPARASPLAAASASRPVPEGTIVDFSSASAALASTSEDTDGLAEAAAVTTAAAAVTTAAAAVRVKPRSSWARQMVLMSAAGSVVGTGQSKEPLLPATLCNHHSRPVAKSTSCSTSGRCNNTSMGCSLRLTALDNESPCMQRAHMARPRNLSDLSDLQPVHQPFHSFMGPASLHLSVPPSVHSSSASSSSSSAVVGARGLSGALTTALTGQASIARCANLRPKPTAELTRGTDGVDVADGAEVTALPNICRGWEGGHEEGEDEEMDDEDNEDRLSEGAAVAACMLQQMGYCADGSQRSGRDSHSSKAAAQHAVQASSFKLKQQVRTSGHRWERLAPEAAAAAAEADTPGRKQARGTSFSAVDVKEAEALAVGLVVPLASGAGAPLHAHLHEARKGWPQDFHGGVHPWPDAEATGPSSCSGSASTAKDTQGVLQTNAPEQSIHLLPRQLNAVAGESGQGGVAVDLKQVGDAAGELWSPATALRQQPSDHQAAASPIFFTGTPVRPAERGIGGPGRRVSPPHILEIPSRGRSQLLRLPLPEGPNHHRLSHRRHRSGPELHRMSTRLLSSEPASDGFLSQCSGDRGLVPGSFSPPNTSGQFHTRRNVKLEAFQLLSFSKHGQQQRACDDTVGSRLVSPSASSNQLQRAWRHHFQLDAQAERVVPKTVAPGLIPSEFAPESFAQGNATVSGAKGWEVSGGTNPHAGFIQNSGSCTRGCAAQSSGTTPCSLQHLRDAPSLPTGVHGCGEAQPQAEMVKLSSSLPDGDIPGAMDQRFHFPEKVHEGSQPLTLRGYVLDEGWDVGKPWEDENAAVAMAGEAGQKMSRGSQAAGQASQQGVQLEGMEDGNFAQSEADNTHKGEDVAVENEAQRAAITSNLHGFQDCLRISKRSRDTLSKTVRDRQRRKEIRGWINRLRHAIPTSVAMRQDSASVLQGATDHILWLQSCISVVSMTQAESDPDIQQPQG